MKLTEEQKQSIMDFSSSLDGWAKQELQPKAAYDTVIIGADGRKKRYYCPLGYYANHVLRIPLYPTSKLAARLEQSLTYYVANVVPVINDAEGLTSDEVVERIRHNCQQAIEQG